MADRTKLNWGSILGIGALVLTGCAVVILLVTFMFGSVRGHEFNPQTFDRRDFGFYEIPLIRLQVTPLYRTESTGDVETLVQTRKYVQPDLPAAADPQAADVWRLIDFRRSSYTPPPTDVQILVRYLDAHDDTSNRYWHAWSVKHQNLAALLWPEVARLARVDEYVLIPLVFELARDARDPKAFQASLRKLETTHLQEEANRFQKRSADAEDQETKDKFQARAMALLAASEAADATLQQEIKAEVESE